MLCPFYRYIDKRAAYALPPEILTYGDIFYISVPVPIFSQFNFSDAFIVLVGLSLFSVGDGVWWFKSVYSFGSVGKLK